MKSYADLTKQERKEIVKDFRAAKRSNLTRNPFQLVAAVAREHVATNRGCNGKVGANAYATVLTVLVHNTEIGIDTYFEEG